MKWPQKSPIETYYFYGQRRLASPHFTFTVSVLGLAGASPRLASREILGDSPSTDHKHLIDHVWVSIEKELSQYGRSIQRVYLSKSEWNVKYL